MFNLKSAPLAVICLCCLVPAVGGGCFFAKKGSKPKESTAIAREVEETFRQRWIEKRGAELVGRGMAPDLARAQAIEEFKAQYNFPSAPAR